jgi:hypothetical protein
VNEPHEIRALAAADISEYLASVDDFAFEREVYHVAHSLRFEAEHAALYTDPVTEKPRQFDVRASYTAGTDKIALAIECKGLSRDFPLLLSCVPRTGPEAYHQILIADDVMGPGQSFTRIRTVPSKEYYSPYAPNRGVGKSMRQVRREVKGLKAGQMVSGEDIFDKWMQALASLSEMIDSGARQLRAGKKLVHQIAFLPILVVSDGTIWVADYSSRGELQREPFEVDSIEYYLARKYPLAREGVSLTITHLHIMTRTKIRSFLEEIALGGSIWQGLFGG